MGILDDILAAGRPFIPMMQYDKEGKVIKVQSMMIGDNAPTPSIPWVCRLTSFFVIVNSETAGFC